MSFKRVSLAAVAAVCLFLGGCTQPRTTQIELPKSALDSVNLPNEVAIDGEKFVLKQKNARTAEYYLPNEKVGFKWSKLVSVTVDENADINEYQKAFVTALKSGQFGKAEYDFKSINDKEYQAYTIYYPIAGNPDFDNYDINLIHVKSLNCGLRVTHYALKFLNIADRSKFHTLIKQKMPIFLAQLPQVECK